MKRSILYFLFTLLFPAATGLANSLSGYVFLDKNSNGIRDKNEEGIKGVVVSDQVQVIETTAEGYYQFGDVKGFGIVFISLPNGYKTITSFWQKIPAGSQGQLDFALLKTDSLIEFRFIHASDTHVSEKSLDRMEKLRRIIEQVKPDFMVVTGDLVRDALRVSEKEATGYFELYTKEIQKMPVPVWSVPGNHELFGIERHMSLVSSQHPLYGRKMTRHYVGPDYYSFNYGGIHFIGLNSVDYEDLWYFGHVDSTQVEWLKKDLATVPPTTPVITFNHIPLVSGGFSLTPFQESGPGRSVERENGILHYRHLVSNAQDVLAILNKHAYPLALSGHYHAAMKFTFEAEGQKTRFEQTAAVVGPSEDGNIKMLSGITVYHVKDGKIDDGIFMPLDKK